MSKAPASDWPDVSPAGLRKMAEIAAPNNGAVFRAAADEIERLSARAEPSTPPAGERELLIEALGQFEVKERGVPQAHIAAQLVAELRAALATQPLEQKPVAIVKHFEDGLIRKAVPLTREFLDLPAETLLYAGPQPEQVAQDSARLEWLCQQFVTVRIPLRYGSRECFMGSPDDNDGESVPWDIRSKIDAARAATKPQGGA